MKNVLAGSPLRGNQQQHRASTSFAKVGEVSKLKGKHPMTEQERRAVISRMVQSLNYDGGEVQTSQTPSSFATNNRGELVSSCLKIS